MILHRGSIRRGRAANRIRPSAFPLLLAALTLLIYAQTFAPCIGAATVAWCADSVSGGSPTEGAVRVSQQDDCSPSSGRVEVFLNGAWGTLCANGVDNEAARVICKQLGFAAGRMAPAPVTSAGGSSGVPAPWHLNNVSCSSSHVRLIDCDFQVTTSCGQEHANEAASGPVEASVECFPATNSSASPPPPVPAQGLSDDPTSTVPTSLTPSSCRVVLSRSADGAIDTRLDCIRGTASDVTVRVGRSWIQPLLSGSTAALTPAAADGGSADGLYTWPPASSPDTSSRRQVQDAEPSLEATGSGSDDSLEEDWRISISCRQATPISQASSGTTLGDRNASGDDSASAGDGRVLRPVFVLEDSVLSGLTLSTLGPLLEVNHCSRVLLRNLTLQNLGAPTAPAAPAADEGGEAPPGEGEAGQQRLVYGAVLIDGTRNLDHAVFDGLQCTGVSGATVWGCLLVQARAANATFAPDTIAGAAEGITEGQGTGENQQRPSVAVDPDMAVPDSARWPVRLEIRNSQFTGNTMVDPDASAPAANYGSGSGSDYGHSNNDYSASGHRRLLQGDGQAAAAADLAGQTDAADAAAGGSSSADPRVTLLNGATGCVLDILDAKTKKSFTYGPVLLVSQPPPPGLKSSDDGADALLGLGSSIEVLVENVVMSGNTGASCGGALATIHDLSTLTITSSTFISNSARVQGGSLYIGGSLDSLAILQDSTFQDSTCTERESYGGAIFLSSGVGDIALAHNSSFVRSTAGGGGAIFAYSDIGTLSIQDSSEISGGKSSAGGVIYCNAACSRIQVKNRSKVNYNHAEYEGGFMATPYSSSAPVMEILLSDSEVGWNVAHSMGAVLSLHNRDLMEMTITAGSRIHDNDGGVVFCDGNIKSFIISDGAVVSNNTARSSGGVLMNSLSPELIIIANNSVVSNNSAKYSGGVLAIGGNYQDTKLASLNLIIQNGSVVSDNSAFNGAVLSTDVLDVVEIRVESGAVVSGNRASISTTATVSGMGGAFYVDGSLGSFVVTTGAVVANNSADRGGGALHFKDTLEVMRISHGAALTKNTAKENGGAVNGDCGPILLLEVEDGASISGNSAAGSGGAIYTSAIGHLVISAGIIRNNTSLRGDGGAICMDEARFGCDYTVLSKLNRPAPKTPDSSLVIEIKDGSVFADNTATGGNGGALMLKVGGPSNISSSISQHSSSVRRLFVNISDSLFVSNRAGSHGGAIGIYQVTELGGGDLELQGTPLFQRDLQISIFNTTFGNNIASWRPSDGLSQQSRVSDGQGGAVFLWSPWIASPNATATLLAPGNTIISSYLPPACRVDMYKCILEGNVAGDNGGGLLLANCAGTLRDSEFRSNRATGSGAAVAIIHEDLPTASGSQQLDDDSDDLTADETPPAADATSAAGAAVTSTATLNPCATDLRPPTLLLELLGLPAMPLPSDGLAMPDVPTASSDSSVGEPAGRCNPSWLEVQSCAFLDNAADQNGGGVSVGAGAIGLVYQSHFRNNTAVGMGGGVSFAKSCIGLIGNTSLATNTAGRSGGGVSTSGAELLLLHDTKLEDNLARSSGGGLSSHDSRWVHVKDTLLGSNVAVLGGGAFITATALNRSSTVLMYKSSLLGNSAQESLDSSDARGGGLFIEGRVAAALYDVRIQGNTASRIGAAIATASQTCSSPVANHNLPQESPSVFSRPTWFASISALRAAAQVQCFTLALIGGTRLYTQRDRGIAAETVQLWSSDPSYSSLIARCRPPNITTGEDYNPPEIQLLAEYTLAAVTELLYRQQQPQLQQQEAAALSESETLAGPRRALEPVRYNELTESLGHCVETDVTSSNGHAASSISSATLGAQVLGVTPGEVRLVRLIQQQVSNSSQGARSGISHQQTPQMQLRTGVPFDVYIQLYDTNGNPITADAVPYNLLRISMELVAAAANSTDSSGNTSCSPADVANLEGPVTDRSITRPFFNGVASWLQVQAYAWPGQYVLRFKHEDDDEVLQRFGMQKGLPPLQLDIEVLPCRVGEQLNTQYRTTSHPTWISCQECAADSVALWRDQRGPIQSILLAAGTCQTAAAVAADSNYTLALLSEAVNRTLDSISGKCQSCPSGAYCPRGPMLVPKPGMWHSAANSTNVHRCPFPSACGGGGGAATGYWQALASAAAGRSPSATTTISAIRQRVLDDSRSQLLAECQSAWYGSWPPGSEVISRVAARIMTTNTSSPASGEQTSECVLWQDPSLLSKQMEVLLAAGAISSSDDDSTTTAAVVVVKGDWGSMVQHAHRSLGSSVLTYMQLQCAPGYTGVLCAACQSGYAISPRFECTSCPSLAETIGLGILLFFVGVTVVIGMTYTNFMEDYTERPAGGEEEKEEIRAAEICKAAIVHVQYFIIITRLNINYPTAITDVMTALSSVSWAGQIDVFSTSCLIREASRSLQTHAQVLSSLFTPCLVVLVSMAFWALRFRFFRQALLLRSRPVLLPTTNSGGSSSIRSRRSQQQSSRLLAYLHSRTSGGANSVLSGRSTLLTPVASAATADSLPAPASNNMFTAAPNPFASSQQHYCGTTASAQQQPTAAVVAAPPSPPVARPTPAPAPAQVPAPPPPSAVPPAAAAASADVIFPASPFALGGIAATAYAMATGSGSGKDTAHHHQLSTDDEGAQQSDTPAAAAPELFLTLSEEPHHHHHKRTSSKVPTELADQLSARTSWLLKQVPKSIKRSTSRIAQLARPNPRSAIVHVDTATTLGAQLGIVLMVAVFILYPGWVQATLSIFACYKVDDASDQSYVNQLAAWPYGYWIRDMTQECYSGAHRTFYMPLGIVASLAFCATPPIASFAVLWVIRARGMHRSQQQSLQTAGSTGSNTSGRTFRSFSFDDDPLQTDNHIRQVYGFLYLRYRPQFFWWESVLQLETFALVAAEVFGRTMPGINQALTLAAVLTVITMINITCAPLRNHTLVLLEFSSLAVLALTIVLGLQLAGDSPVGGAGEGFIGVAILLSNGIILTIFAYLLLRRFWKPLKRKWRACIRLITRGRRTSRKGTPPSNHVTSAAGQAPVRQPLQEADSIETVPTLLTGVSSGEAAAGGALFPQSSLRPVSTLTVTLAEARST